MGRKYRPATRPRGGGIITRGLDPREPGDNDDRDGYSDLEEYLNWLARSRVRDQMCGPLRDEQPLWAPRSRMARPSGRRERFGTNRLMRGHR